MQLYSDTFSASRPHNFVHFTVGGYTLVNVRMFWIESANIPNFPTNENLSAKLPNFQARLAMDFVPAVWN